ncbi:ATPase [Spirochaetia bacterium]|nr:ATPase [Spirochaetia bacterium]
MEVLNLLNPYRPGAGHTPPYLAGREQEIGNFVKLLDQQIIIKNCILTGLRGVGKTVLLDEFKNVAINEGWLWTSNEISESVSLTEERLCYRIMADLSIVTSGISIKKIREEPVGFTGKETEIDIPLNFRNIEDLFDEAAGLESDKLKYILEYAWDQIKRNMPQVKGLIFAYDEAQSLYDDTKNKTFALTMLLDVFQSIQRKKIPFMLLLSGLPTIQSRLVESRTYTERMFTILFLHKLSDDASRLAILKPIERENCPIQFNKDSIDLITHKSGGYPYFIQFLCKETFDIFLQQNSAGQELTVPIDSIMIKLDDDFFAGRWGILTDRQRELLSVIAHLESCEEEFTVQKIVTESKKYEITAFSNSQVNQMLSSLIVTGLIFKNRFGKYSFAVPQLNEFILRQNIAISKL